MSGDGKVFLIRSRMHGKVLDIEGGDPDPPAGTRCIMWEQKNSGENANQLWSDCPLTGTIRSYVKHDFCLDVNAENEIVVMPVQHGDQNQAWDRTNDMIINRNTGKGVDIDGASESSGTRCLAWDIHGNSNQKWDFDYQPARYFYIVSDLNGKVMDVCEADPSPGAKVIMWSRKDSLEDNQLWYEGRGGFIRSKLNDYALDLTDDGLTLQPQEPGKSSQRFCFDCHDRGIVCIEDRGTVLDIKGEDDGDGAEICSWGWKEGSHQKWRFEYV